MNWNINLLRKFINEKDGEKEKESKFFFCVCVCSFCFFKMKRDLKAIAPPLKKNFPKKELLKKKEKERNNESVEQKGIPVSVLPLWCKTWQQNLKDL